MEKLNKLIGLFLLSLLMSTKIAAQSIPTLELARSTFAPFPPVVNSGFGSGIAPMTATFVNDETNNGTFAANSNVITVTASFQNQAFTGLNYGSGSTAQTTGLAFGLGPTTGGNAILGGSARNRWDILGAYTGSFGPNNPMYTSNPTAVGAQLGTGIEVGTTAPFDNSNGAFEIFTTAYELYKRNIPISTRVLFGQVKLTFSQPVKNPVVQIAGLGGSFRYSVIGLPVNDPNSWRSTYFSTELELQTPGVTSTRLSGNQFFDIVGNNILNSNNANPNGASVNDPNLNIPPSFNDFGAASGSVRINGTVTELVYNVYLEGGTNSQFAWGVDKSQVLSASTDPFAGDIWYIAASFDKPTQQIFGNVFIDKDATDGDINKSFTLPNEGTNANGQLYANLISAGGIVIASVPVGANGAYAFDNVLPATGYTVQITTNQGVVSSAKPATVLPPNWTRTGEIIGTGAGSTGVTGTSAPFNVLLADIITNVNFGIKAGNCPTNILSAVVPTAGYFGGFEMAENFFPTYVNLTNGPGRVYANTPLTVNSSYKISTTPNSLDASLNSFNSLSGTSQMVVKPTASNQLAYYIVDSLGKNTNGFQTYLLSGTGSSFKGWFAKAGSADAVVKIKIYDADDVSKVFLDQDVSVTGIPGNWVYWDKPWTINYGTPGVSSLTKKVRLDIISVNGAPFSIDELCFTESNAGPTLPISLSEFTANKSACTANLVWKTSSEGNSDRFEVEVKGGATAAFAPVGTVAASGNSNTTKTYQFNYQMQAGIIYYYRIKMIDKDGTFTYSDTRTLSCSKLGLGIVIAPNPVIDIFNIRGMEDGKNLVTVYSASGQLVRSQIIAQNQGDVNIFNLAPGMYTVKITSEKGNTVVEKLIKY